jgi:hypothetical protein
VSINFLKVPRVDGRKIIRWCRRGVFSRVFAELAGKGASPTGRCLPADV